MHYSRVLFRLFSDIISLFGQRSMEERARISVTGTSGMPGSKKESGDLPALWIISRRLLKPFGQGRVMEYRAV